MQLSRLVFVVVGVWSVMLLGVTFVYEQRALRHAQEAALHAECSCDPDLSRLRCDFDYPGPLRIVDMNCFLEVFPFATPLKRLVPVENGTHDLTGISIPSAGPRVPIFIPFRDRVSDLVETLRSFHRHIRTPFEIVIWNDRTSYPAAVKFLERLADAGVRVVTNTEKWEEFAETKGIRDEFDTLYYMLARFVRDYMDSYSKSEYYVLTDPDCALDSAPPDILDIYKYAMNNVPDVTIVGAYLRLDDWPEGLPSIYQMMQRKLPPEYFEYMGKYYYFVRVKIDTTFAMYRRDTAWVRMRMPAIRMLPPLGIRHLDYYIDASNAPADWDYYRRKVRDTGVNHMWHINTKDMPPIKIIGGAEFKFKKPEADIGGNVGSDDKDLDDEGDDADVGDGVAENAQGQEEGQANAEGQVWGQEEGQANAEGQIWGQVQGQDIGQADGHEADAAK